MTDLVTAPDFAGTLTAHDSCTAVLRGLDNPPGETTAHFACGSVVPWLGAHEPTARAHVVERLNAELVEWLRSERDGWTACWCREGSHGEQVQARDCPRHGSDDCRHMAEGFVASLDSLAAQVQP